MEQSVIYEIAESEIKTVMRKIIRIACRMELCASYGITVRIQEPEYTSTWIFIYELNFEGNQVKEEIYERGSLIYWTKIKY